MKKYLFALILGVIAIAVQGCSSKEDEPVVVGTFTFTPVFPEGVEFTAEQLADFGVRIEPKENPQWTVVSKYSQLVQPITAAVGNYVIEILGGTVETDEDKQIITAYYGKTNFAITADRNTEVSVTMTLTNIPVSN